MSELAKKIGTIGEGMFFILPLEYGSVKLVVSAEDFYEDTNAEKIDHWYRKLESEKDAIVCYNMLKASEKEEKEGTPWDAYRNLSIMGFTCWEAEQEIPFGRTFKFQVRVTDTLVVDSSEKAEDIVADFTAFMNAKLKCLLDDLEIYGEDYRWSTCLRTKWEHSS